MFGKLNTNKKGLLTYEIIINMIIIGMLTLLVVGSGAYFSNVAMNTKYNTETNEAFTKLSCIFNNPDGIFSSDNGYEELNAGVIDYDKFTQIYLGQLNEDAKILSTELQENYKSKYNMFISSCNFDDERDATFSAKVYLFRSDEGNDKLKEIYEKNIFIHKNAFEYYSVVKEEQRNTLKGDRSSKGVGSAVGIRRVYHVAVKKDDEFIPAKLIIELVMPTS